MTWEQILPLLPAYLIPLAIVLWAQYRGYWGSSREIALLREQLGREITFLREQLVKEEERTKEWKNKFFELMGQGEVNTESLQKTAEALRDATQIVKQVTR